MHPVAKASAEYLIDFAGVPELLRRQHRNDRMVLAFHNVIGPGATAAGERPLHLPVSDFADFVEELARTHDIIALDDILMPRGRARRPAAAITFDDAYVGCVEYALPELAKRGLPSTVFVTPGLLGARACWWDLAWETHGPLPQARKDHALDELRGDSAAIIAELALAPQAALLPIATEADLCRAARMPGVTFGAHGWTHRNLAALGPAELADELRRPLAWLRERFAVTRPWVAYPYGRWGPHVSTAAADAGYTMGFRADYGWITPTPSDVHAMLRFSVGAGTSLRGFRQRCSGIGAA